MRGWCIYRHFESPYQTTTPAWIVMELPAAKPDGRYRIRVVVHPLATAVCTTNAVHREALALSPPGGFSYEALKAESPEEFAARWRRKRRTS